MVDKHINILLVEDNPGDARLIQEMLSEANGARFDVTCADRLSTGLELLAAEKVDVLLLDLGLPDSTGLESFARVYAHAPEIPIVVLSGLDDETLAVMAVREGAQDYLIKGHVDSSILEHSIRYAIERKQAGDALREREASYRELADSVSDIFFAMDRDLRYIYWNKASEELTGIKAKDAIGKSIFEIFQDSEDTRRAVAAYREVLKNQQPTSFVNEHELNGKNFFFEISAYPSKDGLSVFVKDITERKQAEEERVAILKKFEAKNRELDNFAYKVSHDLRSPLFSIQGYTTLAREALERGTLEKLASNLERIENAALKMDRLLNETLRLARVGQAINQPEDVSFGAIVQEVLEEAAVQIQSKKVTISVAEDFPTVHVDRMRIREVLLNLVENSIKYLGEQSHPEIDIGYRVDGNETVFFVKDNGIGIDPSQHEKVFELFYRLDKKGNGVGAGLAIVKRIIEVHGGRVWIESETGKGCTIYFTMPLTNSMECGT